MYPKLSKTIAGRIEEQIEVERNNYAEALKADMQFQVLKTIKARIKLLEEKLKETQTSYIKQGERHNF